MASYKYPTRSKTPKRAAIASTRYSTRSKSRTVQHIVSSDTTPSPTEPSKRGRRRVKINLIFKKALSKVVKSKTQSHRIKQNSAERLADIEATRLANETAQIEAERARKDELRARPQGLKPPGTIRLTINSQTYALGWAVEFGDHGSSIIFDVDNKKDAEVAGAIFRKNYRTDTEDVPAYDLAMVPVHGSDEFEMDDSESLVPRQYKGSYYNAAK